MNLGYCPAAGQLVLREKPVATVLLAQYAASACHMCLRELPTGQSAVEVAPAVLHEAQQYKLYCSPACASADTHAVLTAPVHGRLDKIAAAAQVQQPFQILYQTERNSLPLLAKALLCSQ